jgi:hypothetical protein
MAKKLTKAEMTTGARELKAIASELRKLAMELEQVEIAEYEAQRCADYDKALKAEAQIWAKVAQKAADLKMTAANRADIANDLINLHN